MALGKALGGGSSSALTVKDEGVTLSSAVTSIDAVGSGITATNVGGAVTLTVAGGSGAEVLIDRQSPSGTGTVTFSSLGSYTDLRVVVAGGGTKVNTSVEVRLRFNGDTATSYDYQTTLLNQSNDADVEGRVVGYILCGYLAGSTAPAGAPGNIDLRIFDYRGTTFWKTVNGQNFVHPSASAGFIYNDLLGGTWRSTSAITSIEVYLDSGNYVSGTKVALFGIS